MVEESFEFGSHHLQVDGGKRTRTLAFLLICKRLALLPSLHIAGTTAELHIVGTVTEQDELALLPSYI